MAEEIWDDIHENDFEFIPNKYVVGEEVESLSGETHWLPVVDTSLKPVKGTLFDSIFDALKFYQEYARHGGFEVRKSTQKPTKSQRDYNGQQIIKLKYFVCSREGFNSKKEEKNTGESCESSMSDITNAGNISGENTISDVILTRDIITNDTIVTEPSKKSRKQTRRRVSQRMGCPASFKLQITNGNKYELYHFEEEHNHCLVHPKYMHHVPAYRKLDNHMKVLLYHFAQAGIGPTESHRILTKMYGVYDKVGATDTKCRNNKRHFTAYIGKADAQMLVNMFLKKKECLPNFSFEYFTKPNGKLRGLFWADEHAKLNYAAFGDVVSFDATFRSNKYKMVFVPFTSIDNHKKCVTFGVALLAKEDIDPYKWLLAAFKNAFPREPKMVLTDQCPSMKSSVESVFTKARRRLCMWHIMEKLSVKVGASISNSGLKEQLSKIVWTDKIDAETFETRWVSILKHFDLLNHKWLHDMFALRFNWIPAYFRDWSMYGLMRTSSRSESENHMFGQLMNSSHFETYMQDQRFKQSKNDVKTVHTNPDVTLCTPLEKDAARCYTHNVFFYVQLEIIAAQKHCMCLNFIETEGCKKFTIIDVRGKSMSIDDSIDRVAEPRFFDELIPNKSEVFFGEDEQLLSCSCKRFERTGLLCRHMFYVLKICNVDSIPKKYIVIRWTRDAVPVSNSHQMTELNVNRENMEGIPQMVKDIYNDVNYCVNRLMVDTDALSKYRESQHQLVLKTEAIMSSQPPIGSKEFIATMVGLPQPENITVHPPEGIVNKGGGKRTRITSSHEESIKNSNKPLRRCAFRKIKTDHDIRNCTKRKEHEAAEAAAVAAASSENSEKSSMGLY